MSHCALMAGVLLSALVWLDDSIAQEHPEDALARHMAHLITDGDQWHTPNPGFEPGGPAAQFFGLTFDLAADGSHVSGTLDGIFEDGRTVTYWTLLALYNPVTEKVVTRQIGWDGTLLEGHVPVQTGTTQVVDMIHYQADGTLKISRHENVFAKPAEHVSHVFERDAESGEWARRQSWTWQRKPRAAAAAARSASAQDEAASAPRSAFDAYARYLAAGSGQWRAPNPDYEPDSGEPAQFGMHYRWGPHRQHLAGEIVSVYPDGRVSKDWSLYLTRNPVTDEIVLEQTGKRGVYFRGELRKSGDGEYHEYGLIYLPNGTVKSVHDRVEIVDADTRVSHVYDRADDGRWRKVREWTWRRVGDGRDTDSD